MRARDRAAVALASVLGREPGNERPVSLTAVQRGGKISDMVKVFFVVAVLGGMSLMAPTARADEPCAAVAEAARAAGLDPSLGPPAEAAAIKLMRTGGAHYDEASKRLAVVATRDQAAGEFQAAIDAYAAAAMISTAPVILYNLAHTYRAAGDHPRAIEQYRSFLDRGRPGPVLRAFIECHISSMTAKVDRAASAAPPAKPGPSEDPTANGEPATDSQPRALWHQDATGWTISGAGAVTLGLGGFLLLDARGLAAEARSEPRDDVRDELDAKADRRRNWGTAITVVGAAVLTAGVVKLIMTPDATLDARPSVTVAVGPGGFFVGGWF